MKTLQATYSISAPMFLAADRYNAELRPPSFKGVLRFWFRAIALSRYQNDLEVVREQEDKLFGSTNGQAAFLLRLQPTGELEHVPKEQRWYGQESAYLGYGLIDYKNRQLQNTRAYIKEGLNFTAKLLIKQNDKVQAESINILKQALIAMGLFGGLGARSRRGYGSISLIELKENDQVLWTGPKNEEQLIKSIEDFFLVLGNLTDGLPKYSAFSNQSCAAVVLTNNNANGLLRQLGEQLINYRKNYQRDDAKLVLQALQGKKVDKHPKRVVFGLPHNYFFKGKPPRKLLVAPHYQRLDRRASPLFIHIHKLENDYAAVLLLLPAEFLPDGAKIKMGKHNVPVDVDYQILRGFMKSFPQGRMVLPGE